MNTVTISGTERERHEQRIADAYAQLERREAAARLVDHGPVRARFDWSTLPTSKPSGNAPSVAPDHNCKPLSAQRASGTIST